MIWELRAAWGSGRRVALSLSERCAHLRRVEGPVQAVATTGVTVTVSGWKVPVEDVLAVHHPSRLGDSTARGDRFHGSGYAPPQDEELPL